MRVWQNTLNTSNGDSEHQQHSWMRGHHHPEQALGVLCSLQHTERDRLSEISKKNIPFRCFPQCLSPQHMLFNPVQCDRENKEPSTSHVHCDSVKTMVSKAEWVKNNNGNTKAASGFLPKAVLKQLSDLQTFTENLYSGLQIFLITEMLSSRNFAGQS